MYVYDPEQITFFAKTDARGKQVPFGIKANDRTRHVYVIGKTGMGKSTLLENMAAQDLKNGNGLAFIDPHGQTAETLLDYIPEERKDDVLYFAPFDTDNPISFNVMEDVGADKRHLVVAGLMSVFKKIWVDAWSARMEYILSNTLLALLEYPDSTLLGVNRMLSDKDYRMRVIENITDPAVKSFWVDEFLKYNERYMQEAGDAIKNKIGQFTSNPLIRNIIGQPHTSFNIREVMDERKIMIINLSKGLVGEQNANLLGSMMTTRIYLAAMSRADLTAEELKSKPNFYFYVDEFQSFANATFADILSEARKYKLNLTIAHQYVAQMEDEVRDAVFGNVGTLISFRVGPFDAEVLETVFTPKFTAPDIVNLGFAQIYLTLMIDGIGSAPFSATTLPPIETPANPVRDQVIASSRTNFSKPRNEIETTINDWHHQSFSDKPPYVPKHLREKANGGDLPNTGENLKKYGVDGVAPKEEQDTSAVSSTVPEDALQPPTRPGHGPAPDRNKGGGAPHGGLRENNRGGPRGDRRGGDRPPRDTNRGGGGGPKGAPKPQQEAKSLDELRSVLKGISDDSGGAKKEDEKPKRGPNKDARDENGEIKKDPEALKGALAAALGSAAAAGITSTSEDERGEKGAAEKKAPVQKEAQQTQKNEVQLAAEQAEGVEKKAESTKEEAKQDVVLSLDDTATDSQSEKSVSETLKDIAPQESAEQEVKEEALEGLEEAVQEKSPDEVAPATATPIVLEGAAAQEGQEKPKRKRKRKRKKKNTEGKAQDQNSREVSTGAENNNQQSERKTDPAPQLQQVKTVPDVVRTPEPVAEKQAQPQEQPAAPAPAPAAAPESSEPKPEPEQAQVGNVVLPAPTVALAPAPERREPLPEHNDYAQAKNRQTVDPLAPKKLERMMRVTTSDKSPLK